MPKIVECVPNFSEGRNMDVVQKIIAPFIPDEGLVKRLLENL